MQFDLVTPEKQLVSQQVDYVNLPGTEGYFGVLPGHQPLLSTLADGLVTVKTGETKTVYTVSGGFVDVDAQRVTVLAERAEQQ